MSSEDPPSSLDTERVRDPDAEEWQPMTGPFWWGERTESQEAAWVLGSEKFAGIGIRDTENPQTEFICSNVFIADIRGMV